MANNKNGRLAGRIALITGASRGIGRAVARRFAQEGGTVIAVARSLSDLETLDDEIKAESGKNAVLVNKDLTEFDAIDQIGSAIFDRYKRLDVLVGVAGTLGQLSPVTHVPLRMWKDVFDLHVTANWRLLRSVDPLLRQSKAGRAIFVTCSQGCKPSPFWGAYGASKAALEHMVLTYASELKETTVKANILDPGPVRTALRLRAFPGEDQSTLKSPEETTSTFVEMASSSYLKTGERVNL